MKGNLFLRIVYEVAWFAFAIIAAYLLILPIRAVISDVLNNYMLFSLVFIFTYLRWIAFMPQSILMESVFAKIGLFIINVPLFFYLLNLYFKYGRVFDEYNYTLPATVFQHIKSGTELDDLMYIKNLVTFSGIATLTLILLMEAKITYEIFKLRQLDKYLYKKK